MLRRVAIQKKTRHLQDWKWTFCSGSRAEGLSMRIGWGHDEPDLDIMYLWERLWGVYIKTTPPPPPPKKKKKKSLERL